MGHPVPEGDRAGQQGGYPQHLPQSGAPQEWSVQRGPGHHRASPEPGDMMDILVKVKRDWIYSGSSSA